jgi:SOS-response transcriptional repressor LexA
MRPLTNKQRCLLLYCDTFLTQNDQLPTLQAITDHFGWASTNAAFEAMAALERKGLVERNTLGKMRFTEAGRRLIPECAAYVLSQPDRRYVLADERYCG